MNANFIKARIDALVLAAERCADENAILEEWYRNTAETARKLEQYLEKDVAEFENMALALSALQSNVPMLDTSILFNGVEAMLTEIDRYNPGDADTAYGNVIKVTKDSIANVGSVIIETLQSIAILEIALGIGVIGRPSTEVPKVKIPDEYRYKKTEIIQDKIEYTSSTFQKVAEPAPEAEDNGDTTDDDEPILTPNEFDRYGAYLSKTAETSAEKEESIDNTDLMQTPYHPADLNAMIREAYQTTEEEKHNVPPISPAEIANERLEQFQKDTGVNVDQMIAEAMLTESEPEPETEEQSVERPKTLFGIPIETLQQEVPDVDIDALIEPEPVKPAPTAVKSEPVQLAPDNPGVKPQRLSKGFTEVHLPGFPSDQFMISDKNLLVDRYTGRVIRTFRRHGIELVSVRHYGLGNTEDVFKFEDIIRAAKGEPIHATTAEPESPTVDEKATEEKPERFQYVNWINGLPKTKYKVFESGRIYDTVYEEFVVGSGEKITLSSGDRDDKTPGVRSPKFAFTRQSLVYRAFHPEVRDMIKLHIKFKDGNRKNCALSNLVYKG